MVVEAYKSLEVDFTNLLRTILSKGESDEMCNVLMNPVHDIYEDLKKHFSM